MSVGRPVADWRNAEAYSWLAACGRHAFAWEWLRRLPAYREAWRTRGRNSASAAAFGLHALVSPDEDARTARLLWRADADPFVLTATATAAAKGEGFDIRAVAAFASVLLTREGERWLFAERCRQLRLDVITGTLREGPVPLRIHIDGLGSAPVIALERLVALHRHRRLLGSLFGGERRAGRWAEVLRVHDARAAGATQREIAQVLFGLNDVARWRVSAPCERRRVQRLVEATRRAARADPRDWLSGRFP